MIRKLLFHNFRSVYTVDHWVKRRFTKGGLLVIGGIIAGGIFGIDTRQSYAYQIFTLGCGLLIIAMLSSLAFRLRFKSKRFLPPYGVVGEPLTYRVIVRNLSSRIQRDLWLSEKEPLRFPSFKEFLNAKDIADRQRNWFDRYVGYPRWMSLMRKHWGVKTAESPLPLLPAHRDFEAQMRLTPLRRGYLELVGLCLTRPDPLGLFKAFCCQPCAERLLILPRFYPLPLLNLPGGRKYQQGGVHLSLSVGDAVEFVALREYHPGDSLRHIHWKSWAKLGKPIVKEFQDEFFVRRALVLDTFTNDAQSDAQFEEVISVAASFAHLTSDQDALLDFMFVGETTYTFTMGRGLTHLDSVLEILACVEPCVDKSFNILGNAVLKHVYTLSGAICILLTWDEPRRQWLEQLQHLQLPLLVLIITDTPEAFSLPDIRRIAARAYLLKTSAVAEELAKLADSL